MPRKTLIFGNGLGMALNAEAFSLSNAIAHVWESDDILSDDQRSLISACLEESVIDDARPPQGEHELGRLQRVLAACDFLRSIEVPGSEHWLTERGQEFPDAIRTFLHQVASRFHGVDELPDGFVVPLCEFIRRSYSHVATLNYDDLLYRPFIDHRICDGWRGSLVDGVTNGGYSEGNLVRRFGNDFGWYLHLHGSPLFFTNAQGAVQKLALSDLQYVNVRQSHIVLTHVRSKPSVIQSSDILKSYWSHFSTALEETNEAILFGYSGLDDHVNGLFAKRSSTLRTRVVEWSGDGASDDDRSAFWKKVLNSDDVDLVRMPDILEFTDW